MQSAESGKSKGRYGHLTSSDKTAHRDFDSAPPNGVHGTRICDYEPAILVASWLSYPLLLLILYSLSRAPPGLAPIDYSISIDGTIWRLSIAVTISWCVTSSHHVLVVKRNRSMTRHVHVRAP